MRYASAQRDVVDAFMIALAKAEEKSQRHRSALGSLPSQESHFWSIVSQQVRKIFYEFICY